MPVAPGFETAACDGFADGCDPLLVLGADLFDSRRTVGEWRTGELRKAEGDGMVIVSMKVRPHAKAAQSQWCSHGAGSQRKARRSVAIMLNRLWAKCGGTNAVMQLGRH